MQSLIYNQLIPEGALLDLYTAEAHRLHIHGSIAVIYDITREITVVACNLDNNFLAIPYNGETPKRIFVKTNNSNLLPIHPKIVDDILKLRQPAYPLVICHDLPISYYTSLPSYTSKDHLCLKSISIETLPQYVRESILRGWTGMYLVILYPLQLMEGSINLVLSIVTSELGGTIKNVYIFSPYTVVVNQYWSTISANY